MPAYQKTSQPLISFYASSPEEQIRRDLTNVVNSYLIVYQNLGLSQIEALQKVSEYLKIYIEEPNPDKTETHNKVAKSIKNNLEALKQKLIEQNEHYR